MTDAVDTDIINKIGTTRVGRIVIPIQSIKEEPEMVQNVWSYCIPLACVYVRRVESHEWLCRSDEFDELSMEKRELIPLYHHRIHSDGRVTFTRTAYKRIVDTSISNEIVATIMEHKVDMDAFKAWLMRFKGVTEEDFMPENYNEDFLEAMRIYVARRDDNALI